MKEKLDRLLYNGSIHTLKSENDVVEALGINDGKIVFAGSDCEDRQSDFCANMMLWME